MTYPNELTNPAQANWPTRVNEALKSNRGAMLYAPNDLTTTGLVWGYFGGDLSDSVTVADGVTSSLASATTVYAVMHRTTGVLTHATTTTNWNDTTTYGRVRRFVTGASSITSSIDWRFLAGGIFDRSVLAAGDVVGPASATNNNLAQFDGTTGKLLEDSGVAISTDGTMAANSASKVPVESAIVTYVAARIAALIASAPGALDTLDELAAALGDDGNFASTVTTALAGKQPLDSDLTTIAGLTATTDNFLQAKSSAWASRTPTQVAADLSSLVKPTEHIIIACSDETTALTTGNAKVTFRMPYAFTLTDVRASVTTAPTGGTLLTVDVNEAGTTVLSTKLTFDASEKTTTTAATPRVISDSSLADDAEITIDIDAVGSTIAGAGLKVTLIGSRT